MSTEQDELHTDKVNSWGNQSGEVGRTKGITRHKNGESTVFIKTARWSKNKQTNKTQEVQAWKQKSTLPRKSKYNK